MSNEIALSNPSVFANSQAFETAQRIASALSKSNLVPKEYQGNIPNCLIAIEVAQRTQASPLMVMQNLYIVHGRPSWSSQFIIAAINSCGRFAPLRFKMDGEGDKRTCYAETTDKNGEILPGPPVSIDMAKKEGWYQKNGSKWQTMPEVMLRYRAASFFGRLYAPDILMGMQTAEEVEDFTGPDNAKDITPKQPESILENINEAIKAEKESDEPAEVTSGPAIPSTPPIIRPGYMVDDATKVDWETFCNSFTLTIDSAPTEAWLNQLMKDHDGALKNLQKLKPELRTQIEVVYQNKLASFSQAEAA